MQQVLLVLLIFLSSTSLLCSQPPPHWKEYNHEHSGFEYSTSSESQHGYSLARIDNTRLVFSDHLLRQISGREYRFNPIGFLFQTVDANDFKGKHVHVSAFARAIQPELEVLEKWFSEQYRIWLADGIDTGGNEAKNAQEHERFVSHEYTDYLNEQFAKTIHKSSRSAHYGLWVLLHMPTTNAEPVNIQKHTSTSVGQISNPLLWNRFNVEVSVPSNCEAISIVFWANGLIEAEVDHFAVVKHGDGQKKNRGWRRLSISDPLTQGLEISETRTKLYFDKSFNNLSFEVR